jgi:hypothetical protein
MIAHTAQLLLKATPEMAYTPRTSTGQYHLLKDNTNFHYFQARTGER